MEIKSELFGKIHYRVKLRELLPEVISPITVFWKPGFITDKLYIFAFLDWACIIAFIFVSIYVFNFLIGSALYFVIRVFSIIYVWYQGDYHPDD